VIIQEVFKRIRRQHLLKGAIHAFPLMNPIGFETGSRNITMSREDLNRSFPGKVDGSLAERIAARVMDAIEQTNPDLVLDLHNDWIKSIPYTVVDPDPGSAHKSAYEKAMVVAGKSGFLVVLDEDDVKSSFSYSLLRRDIPALTIELGESYIVNERNVEYGLNSVFAILGHLGMVPMGEEEFRFLLPTEVSGAILKYSMGTVSAASGIIRFLTKPGELVKRGQPVAKVYNAFGKLQDTVVSPADAIVLSHCDSSVAFPGAPVMAVAML
jgi:predicted deacylase